MTKPKNDTIELREARLEKQRERDRAKISSMTPGQIDVQKFLLI